MQHILESQQFDRAFLESLFQSATELEGKRDSYLKGKILASLFYEPSTRTRLSFESAMLRLGGSVLGTENAGEFSSAMKGETLEDTIRVIGRYADVIVLRHPQAGASDRAASVSPVPIINAGDGAGQHPTQALLDLYTINRERGSIDGARIACVGDLKNGRAVRSMVYLLAKFDDISFTFVSPPELAMQADIKEYLGRHKIPFTETADLEDAMRSSDVVYQTRLQKERFADKADAERFAGMYTITRALADTMKEGAIIMHPLPRVDEISLDTDSSPHAAYFKEAYYGLLIRMALLKHLFS